MGRHPKDWVPPTPPPGATGIQPVEEPLRPGPAVSTGRKATLEEIERWNEEYRAVALADDEEGKSIKRALTAKLKRLTHEELHPDCPDVQINVPQPKGAQGPNTRFFMINEKPYFGWVTVHACVARQLAWMIAKNKDVEERTLQDRGAQVQIDNSGVVERIRRVNQAG